MYLNQYLIYLMKKKNLLILTLIGGLLYITLSSHSAGPAATASLERTGVTGPAGCGGSTCHGPTYSDSITQFISVLDPSGTPVTSYTPGFPYTIRIRAYNNSYSILPKFGYQLTIVRLGTPFSAGEFPSSPGIHTDTVSGVVVSEQTSPLAGTGSGGFGTYYQIDVLWYAPWAGTGPLEIKAIVNAVNNSGTAEAADHWPGPGWPLILPEGPAPFMAGSSPVSPYICVGDSSAMMGPPGGSGTWSSTNPAVATVSGTGVVTAVSPGTSVIAYTVGYFVASMGVTVNPAPAPIAGFNTLCPSGTSTLTDATLGGTWSSSDPSIAAIGSTTGITTSAGASAGTAAITYKIGSTGCYKTIPFTVASPASLSGSSSACAGIGTPFTHPYPGGIWYSSNTSVATVSSSGTVTGVAAGTSVISYSLGTTGCDAEKTITISATPAAAISGSSTVCFDHTITLTGTPAGGTWSSSDASKVVVNTYTGEVTGVSDGTANIMYSVPSSCGPGIATSTVTTSSTGPCTSGINPFALSNEMRIFPNPNRGAFSLNVLATTSEEAHIIVTNIVGAKVREFNVKTNEVNNITLHEPAGTYFLSATTLNSKYFVKIVVE